MNVKMAAAVTLAKIAGTEAVDRALGDAALHGRFATELTKPRRWLTPPKPSVADLLAITGQFYWPLAGTLTDRPWAETNGR